MNLAHSRTPEPGRSEAIPNTAPPTAAATVMQLLAQWRGALFLIAVISLSAGIGQTGLGHSILRAAGLFKQPATYTSLAFGDPQSPLPGKLSPIRSMIPVSFVIKNVGESARVYQWSMQVVQGKKTSRVAVGNITIAAGRQAAITRTAIISCSGGQARIVIGLADPAESIDALAACQSRQKRGS